MSNERQETVADNVSAKHQFRDVAKMIPHEEVDVSKMETTTSTSEKSSAVGNAAAMREALEQIRELLSIGGKPDTAMCIRYEAAYLIAKESLFVPPRNCDVGTAEEQAERFYAFCGYHRFQSGIKGMCSSLCPCIRCRDMCNCITTWAQMPYEK